jgi:hypothetical protein
MSEQIWVIRAGEKARHADEFLTDGLIGIGFRDVAPDDLANVTEDALKHRPTDAGKNSVGQVINFRYRIEVGDLVVVPRLPKRRDYLVGRVTGGYRFDPSNPALGSHHRPVSWLGTFSRDDLSKGAVDTLGSLLTLFRPTAVEAELRSLLTRLADLQPSPPKVPDRDGGQIDVPPQPPTPTRLALDLPPLHFDVGTDERGRARIVCDHPALVMEQVPRSVDPSRDWAGVPGVYVLTGTDLQTTSLRTGAERTITTTLIVRPWAYVGLSEDFLGRLSSHRQSKPEWRRALLVRSGGTAFTSDDIKYLELRVHGLLLGTEEVLMPQATPRGNLSAQPRNPTLLDACGDAVVSVLRLTGILI